MFKMHMLFYPSNPFLDIYMRSILFNMVAINHVWYLHFNELKLGKI